MLVLGLVSAANAVLSLSVGGAPAPDEITLSPSDDIVLDVQSDGTAAYAVILEVHNPTARTLSNPRTTQGNMSAAYYYGPPTYVPPTYPYPYFDIGIADSAGALVPGTGFEVDFHCDGPEDVLVRLIDYDTGAVLDSLLIHQPEPMTIALLGLGGLFLRRRK